MITFNSNLGIAEFIVTEKRTFI